MIQDNSTSTASLFSKLGLLAAIKSIVSITALNLHYLSRMIGVVAASLFQVFAVYTFNPVFAGTKRRGNRATHSLTASPNVEAKLSLLGKS